MKNILLLLTTFFISSLTFSQSTLVFTYDAAGNQIERKFETSSAKQINKVIATEEQEVALLDDEDLLEQIANSIIVYPNPSNGNVRLEWESGFEESIKEINVSDSGALKTFQVPLVYGQNYVDINLTNYASGLYLIHFVFDDTKIIVKKIIKN